MNRTIFNVVSSFTPNVTLCNIIMGLQPTDIKLNQYGNNIAVITELILVHVEISQSSKLLYVFFEL